MKLTNLTGQQFGKLTVLEHAGKKPSGKHLWRCVCTCGREVIVAGANLKTGHTRSCGCYQLERLRATSTTHGKAPKGSRRGAYSIWANMVQRCNNPKNERWADYGGRGIKVCEHWLTFANFLADMGDPPASDLTIERIDNDRGYEPGNCRWATRQEQSNNTRRNRLITYGGKTQTLAQWSRDLGLNRRTISERLRKGWTVEQALFTHPVARTQPSTPRQH